MATKEEIYDSQINPLMAQIIAICKEHKIAHVCSFALGMDEGDGELLCTSTNLLEQCEPPENFSKALDEIYGKRNSFTAFTITTTKATNQ